MCVVATAKLADTTVHRLWRAWRAHDTLADWLASTAAGGDLCKLCKSSALLPLLPSATSQFAKGSIIIIWRFSAMRRKHTHLSVVVAFLLRPCGESVNAASAQRATTTTMHATKSKLTQQQRSCCCCCCCSGWLANTKDAQLTMRVLCLPNEL